MLGEKMLLRKLTALVFILSVLVTGTALAKDIKVAINLETIKAIKLSEKGGDKLYFSITVYPSNGAPTATRVPFFPIHWLSKELDRVKNVTLWEGTFKEAEGAQIIISLVEQDLEPWDVDDPFGSVKITLSNQNGKLQNKWSIPDYHDKTQVTEIGGKGAPKYDFKGNGGDYQVEFSIKETQ